MELYAYITLSVIILGGWQLIALVLRSYSVVFDIFSHSALIIWIALLLNLGALSILQDIPLILVNSVIIVPLTLYVVEYFERAEIKPMAGERRVRIMSYNVKYGQYKHSQTTDYIMAQSPDVLIMIEPNANWEWHLSRLENAYPHSLINLDARDGYGIALFSKYPFDGEIQIFDEVPYIDVTLNSGGYSLRIVGVHLPNPIHFWTGRWGKGRKMTREILSSIRANQPTLLMGDFNATPNGAICRQIVDSRKLRPLPFHRTLLPTWFIGPVPLLQVDHAFITDSVHALACTLGERNHSDHRPLLLDLEVS